MVGEDGGVGEGGAEEGHGLLGEDGEEVGVDVGLVADDDVDVGEVGLDEDRLELGHVLEGAVEEDQVHDVVADVTFPLDLRRERGG